MATISYSSAGDENDSHFYWNVRIQNPPDAKTAIPASFATSLDQPLLSCPKNWHMIINRMYIPLSGTPCELCVSISFVFNGGHADFQYVANSMGVVLNYASTDYSAPLVFIARDQVTTQNNVISIGQFLQMLNTALAAAFLALKTAHGAFPGVNAPFMVYNASTQLFSLIVDDTASAWVGGATVFFGTQLMTLFSNLDNVLMGYNGGAYKDNQIVIANTGNNDNTVTHQLVSAALCCH